MSERYSRATAYHEAGHAVVAWSFDLPVRAVRVSDDDAGGATDIDSADGLTLIEQIAVLSAGIAAGGVFECPTHKLAGSRDRQKIMELIKAHGISEEGEQARKLRYDGIDYARVRLETHKSKVIKLAERLVEAGRVDASEFLSLMQ